MQPNHTKPMASNFLGQSLSEEEQKLFRLYGKLPNKKDLLQKKLEVSSGYEIADA